MVGPAHRLVLALERDGLLPVLVPRDVDAPRAAAHGAVLLERRVARRHRVDVDIRDHVILQASGLFTGRSSRR
jgi:hypothetical protein